MMFNLFNKKKSDDIDEIIKKINNGDNSLREKFINDYIPFILKIVSQFTGKYVDIKNSEEFSIGLMAFNEAIDRYIQNKNSSFLHFSSQIINRRLIDYVRKNNKNSNVYPFTYFTNEDKTDFEERYLNLHASPEFDKLEFKEELMFIHNKLSEFRITLKNLVITSPKHRDSRQLCIKIARYLANNQKLYERLVMEKKIPKAELAELLNINYKTIHRNTTFIIAVTLILKSRSKLMQVLLYLK